MTDVGSQGKVFIIIRVLLVVLLLGVALVVYWAYFSNLDVIVRAQGVVIPSSRVQTIQSPDGGVLEKVTVKEGDFVEKGAVLVVMDRVKAQSLYQEALAKQSLLQAQVVRLSAEVSGVSPVFSSAFSESHPNVVNAQRILYSKQNFALNEDLTVLKKTYDLVKSELDMNSPMVASGEVSEVEFIRLKRQLNDVNGQIRQRKNKYVSDAQFELAKAEGELAGLNESLVGYKNQVDRADLISPAKGVVKNIKITTEGAVVRPADEIMQIVPVEDELLVDIKINPADVAFIRPGMPVSVKIDAYDYTVYGVLDGRLTYLSPDTFRDESIRDEVKYYRGTVKTKGSQLKGSVSGKIEIIPGMTAVAEIKTGQRTVMQYLLKPITKGVAESLHER